MEEKISVASEEHEGESISKENIAKTNNIEETENVVDEQFIEGENIKNELVEKQNSLVHSEDNNLEESNQEQTQEDKLEQEHEGEEQEYKAEEQQKQEQTQQIDEQQQEEQEDEVDKDKDQKQVDQVPKVEEQVQEEQDVYIEEPPPDPAAPLDLSDSTEAIKSTFELRPEQIAEVEQLWDYYQNYTPAYTDIDGYITEKELVYMLKALLLMTYTPEQLQELIAFCVRPPNPEGHIKYEQFLKMVIIRQRDFPVEDELRSALQVLDPGRTGAIDREYLKEVLAKQGNKLPQKQLNNLIKEVDISNDGTIGIEDVVGTMCIDLNKDDLLMLRASLNPVDPG